MTAVPVTEPAGYDALRALPDTVVGELLDGRLIVSPRPTPRHAECSSVLGMVLGPPFRLGIGGPGGWYILDEPELHLGSDVVVPDLAGWRRSRMPTLPDTPWFELAPDWVCEVLSPSTARHDRVTKLGIYGRAGISYFWLIDPTNRTLEALAWQDAAWTVVGTFADHDRGRVPPFEAIALDLGALWPE